MMLQRPPSPGAARKARYRQRQRRGIVCSRVEVSAIGLEFLISTRWLQQEDAADPVAIGASKRSGPGSVSAAIAEYYGSQAFRSLTGETPAKRRATLERFRELHGDKRLASLPQEFGTTEKRQVRTAPKVPQASTLKHLRCR